MNRQKELGQFFTPLPVVEFIFTALHRLCPDFRHPKTIDPACGEGVFLKYALDNGITLAHRLYGLDKDPTIAERWVEQGIYDKGMRLFNHDGLYEDEKTPGVIAGSFDWVVGNPPFGGLGLRGLQQLALALEGVSLPSSGRRGLVHEEVPLFRDDKVAETAVVPSERSVPSFRDFDLAHLRDLSKALVRDFTLWRDGVRRSIKASRQQGIEGLSAPHTPLATSHKPEKASHKFTISGVEFDAADLPYPQDIPRLERFPIEVLFLERFINLARPGGFIAIIVPDGVLANSTMQYVRDWVLTVCQLIAVVSLPRDTFKGTGTSAKASVMIMRKFGEAEARDGKGQVLMATVERLDALKELAEMFGNPVVKALKCVTPGLRSCVVDPFQQLEGHRIDPDYWHPSDLVFAGVKPSETVRLSDMIGPPVSGYRAGPIHYLNRPGVAIIKVGDIDEVGIDWSGVKFVSKSSPFAAKEKLIGDGDLLICRSGEGGAGRGKLCLATRLRWASCVHGHVYRVPVEEKRWGPYLAVFLRTPIGKKQIQRFASGVGSPELDASDLANIRVYRPSEQVLETVCREYAGIVNRHEAAINSKVRMERARQRGDLSQAARSKAQYQRAMVAAKEHLGDLVRRLQELIERKRERL